MIKCSAPGSLMLMGEHAILRGEPCLVAAIDQRITVNLLPNDHGSIRIHSQLGTYECSLKNIHVKAPLKFVLQALKPFEEHYQSGFDLHITSSFSEKVGFGSSSAVTVATLGAVSKHLNLEMDPMALFKAAREIIREVQGGGSGADVAASVFGGVVYYEMDKDHIEVIQTDSLDIHPIFSGSKLPTPIVLAMVNDLAELSPEVYQNYFDEIGQAVKTAKSALLKQDLPAFYNAIQTNRELMKKIGLENEPIAEIFKSLGNQVAKISGSGLGDCVIAFGETPAFPRNDEQHKLGIVSLAAHLSKTGCQLH